MKNQKSGNKLETLCGIEISKVEEILNEINRYCRNNDLAIELGGEYVYQNDRAQDDAIELTAEIVEILSRN